MARTGIKGKQCLMCKEWVISGTDRHYFGNDADTGYCKSPYCKKERKKNIRRKVK